MFAKFCHSVSVSWWVFRFWLHFCEMTFFPAHPLRQRHKTFCRHFLPHSASCRGWTRTLNQGILLGGKYHCTVDLLFDSFGLACFAKKKFQSSYSLFQTSQTGVQWYIVILPPLVFPAYIMTSSGSTVVEHSPEYSKIEVGNTKGEVSLYLLFEWFGLVCFANKNKNCQFAYSWFQSSQTGGQWYSIPCLNLGILRWVFYHCAAAAGHEISMEY